MREAQLLFAVIEDAAAILRTVIAELRIRRGRIDVAPEYLQQPLITDLGRIVVDLNGFGVARAASGDLLIGRILFVAADIA